MHARARGLTQKQLINELVLHEHMYRSLVESSPEAIILYDMKFRIVMANKQALKIFQFRTAKNFIGKNIFDFIAPHDRAHGRKIAKKTIKESRVLNEPISLLRKTSLSFPAEISLSLIVDVRGVPKNYISIIHDVTERKRTEDALRTSEHKYKTLLKNIPQRIFYKDLDGKYIICNKGLADDLKIKPEEIKGKTDYDFFPKKLADKYRADDRRIMKFGKARDIEERYVRNGRELIVHTYKSPVRNGDGTIMGVFGIFWDISRIKKVERKLELTNKHLVGMVRQLKEQALRDTLTGLYNHHYLGEIIDQQLDRAKKYRTSFSLIMLDVDYFKSVNDLYGHKFGDLVLKEFSAFLKKITPKYDIVIRFSGEEFVILLFGKERFKAMELAQKILDGVNIRYFGNHSHKIKLKISAGIASYPIDKAVNGSDLINKADKVLAKAKEDGGGRIYTSENLSPKKRGLLSENNKKKKGYNILKKELASLTKKAHESIVESIFAFAKTIELKDHYTGEHVDKTVSTATDIAKALGLSKEKIEHIRQAAALHDLGKIGISEKILLKKSKLTKKEFAMIKEHPQIAADILRPIQVLHDIIPLIFYHHERWDGRGYPSGLKAANIPIGARIIALADVYQALISDRPYRKAFPKKKVLEIIKKGRGKQFDPKIVDIFFNTLKKSGEKSQNE